MRRYLLLLALLVVTLTTVATPLLGSTKAYAADATVGAPTAAGNTTATPSCEGGSLGLEWIFCKIYSGTANASDKIFEAFIEPNLKTDPICLDASGASCPGKKNYLYNAWSAFRIYGNIFLVIALLVIVFGESIGGGIIDAYTAKKVLPRLLAAAILINISIYIVAFLVDATNVVGGAIGAVITAPLAGNGTFSIQPSGIHTKTLFAGGIVAAALSKSVVKAFATTDGLSFIAVAFVLPAFLAFMAILVTIVLRKAIIFALIIVAPVAFAMYCLPNTEKYFKKWWETLFQMLAVYPIIVVVFAISNVLSVITGGINSSLPLNNMLSYLLLVLPLFLIPFSFRLAGSAIGRIADVAGSGRKNLNGMMQGRRDRSKAKFNKQVSTKRAGSYAKYDPNNAANVKRNGNLKARAAFGKRFGDTSVAGYSLNRRIGGLGQTVREQSASLNQDARAKTIENDTDALRAGTYDNFEDAVAGLEARGKTNAEARRAANAVKTSIGFGRAQAIWSAEKMAAAGTEFDYGDRGDVARVVARASGGNSDAAASLIGNVNALNKQAGRHDVSSGYATAYDTVREQLKDGAVSQKTSLKAQVEGAQGFDAITLMRDKPKAAGATMAAIKDNVARNRAVLQSTTATANDKQEAHKNLVQLVGQVNQLDAQKGYASGEVQAMVNDLRSDTRGVEQSLVDEYGGGRTGTYEQRVQRDEDGKAVRDAAGVAQMEDDPNKPHYNNQAAADDIRNRIRRSSSTLGQNPNDPNAPTP